MLHIFTQAPHKPSDKPVKTWTTRREQNYVIACVTCHTPWPCEAEGWRETSARLRVYARHRVDCKAARIRATPAEEICTCGLDALLK